MQSYVIHIPAPQEHVWQAYADVERWPGWNETVTAVEPTGVGALRAGSKVRISQPKLKDADYVVTEFRPGEYWAWEARLPGVRTIATHLLTSLEGGRTRVTLTIEHRGVLGRVARAIYRDLIEEYLRVEAEGLRAHCLATAAGRPPACSWVTTDARPGSHL